MAKIKSNLKYVVLRLPKSLAEKISAQASELGISRSAYMCVMLSNQIKHIEAAGK